MTSIHDSTVRLIATRIDDGASKIARAIHRHAEAQVIAAKIAANSQQRAAGNSPMFAEHDMDASEVPDA
jgi:hypothetical protein